MVGPSATVRCDIVELEATRAQGIMHPPPGPLEPALSKQESRAQRRGLTRTRSYELTLHCFVTLHDGDPHYGY